MKRIIATALVLLILVSVIPLGTFTASAATYSGTCGEYLTWEYDDSTYTLTISGTGAMSNYTNNNYTTTTAPWGSYYQTMKTVNIDLGVTSIGYEAFYGCTGLTSITIPGSVTSIGYEAFSYCYGLTSITIPDSVTSIGDWAFEFCEGLTKVNYTGDIAGWCNIEFYGSYSNPLYYAHNLYIADQPVTNLVIPDGVTSIGNYAFSGCSGLTSITIPDSVTSIGGGAFHGCTGLTKVNYTGDIAGWCNIEFYGSYSNPLYYAHNLYIADQPVTNLVIPDGVTSIGNYAFSGCSGLTSITIPDSVTSIGYSAFSDCTGLKDVFYKGTAQQKAKISIDYNYLLTNATWHFMTNLSYKSATCTEAGYTGDMGWKGYEVVTYGEEIPALGHDYIAKITEPTCTKSGYTTHTCSRCKDSYIDSYTDELGHNYNAVITDPTCIAQGYTTHTCSRCKDSYKDNYTYMPCGEKAGFIIKNDKLYIYGTGATDNSKTQAVVPWYDYADQIKEVVIDEGITKIGTYAFYCLSNLESIVCKNASTEFGRYALITTNENLSVYSKSGTLAEYCADNGIRFIDVTATPELVEFTANNITVEAVSGYEYSKDGKNWQTSGRFFDLLPATEYNIYARFAATKDYFPGEISAPLTVTTDKKTVSAPAAPDYLSHTNNSITVVDNPLYEYSIDGESWQASAIFENLNKNIIYRIYARVAETETEYASDKSRPLIIALPGAPVACATEDTISIKAIDGFEYCLDDFIWQDSTEFNMLIDNMDYTVYQRLKAIDGEKVYQITSKPTVIITDNTSVHNESDWITDLEPTVKTAGHRHKECTVCGYILAEEDIERLTPPYTPGDINGDNSINNKDLTRLFQYLSDWNVEVNESALDVNGDGKVNNKDLTRLFQYLSDWDVEIF